MRFDMNNRVSPDWLAAHCGVHRSFILRLAMKLEQSRRYGPRMAPQRWITRDHAHAIIAELASTGTWAPHRPDCRLCGTTGNSEPQRHLAAGYCRSCYVLIWRQRLAGKRAA